MGLKLLCLQDSNHVNTSKSPPYTLYHPFPAPYLGVCSLKSVYFQYHRVETLQSHRIYPSDWVNMIYFDKKRIFTELRNGVRRHIKYNQPGCQMVILQL